MSSTHLEKVLSERLERVAHALRSGHLEAPVASKVLAELLRAVTQAQAPNTFDEINANDTPQPQPLSEELRALLGALPPDGRATAGSSTQSGENPALHLSPDEQLEVEAGEADTSEHSVLGLLHMRSDPGDHHDLRAAGEGEHSQDFAGEGTPVITPAAAALVAREAAQVQARSGQASGRDGTGNGASSSANGPELKENEASGAKAQGTGRAFGSGAYAPTSTGPTDREPDASDDSSEEGYGEGPHAYEKTPATRAPTERAGTRAEPARGASAAPTSGAEARSSGKAGNLANRPPVPRPREGAPRENRGTASYMTEPPSLAAHERLQILHASRYEVRGLLGTGGQGDVREVYDRILQRSVALKALREDLSRQPYIRRAFLREARVLAQLSHPSIVPVYDLGELASGAPAYTMKRISGRSLRDILHGLRRGDPQTREFTRRRLIEVLLQVAHTVGYAHHRGVVHRDLKPGNIMVGDFGEVLVVDWGIARIQGDHPVFEDDEVHYTGEPLIRTNAADPTAQGTIKGTPAYMAPEQARGDNVLVGPWTDVHALGLILYEILLGEPARETGLAEEVVMKAQEPLMRSPERRRVEDRVTTDPIPEELDQICMRCLSEPFTQRYPDGEALARSLRAHLDGQKRREQAELRATEAEIKTKAMAEYTAEIQRIRTDWLEQRTRIKSWATPAEKRPLWELERRLQQLEHQRDEAQNLAILFYSQALDGDPDNRRARAGLSDLYYQRLIQAEHLGRVREARQFESQLRRLDDGRLRERLIGLGSLHLDTTPDRAEVWLYRYESTDNLLQPTDGKLLGKTPVVAPALQMGRYLVVIRMRGGREVYYPIWIRRQTRWEGTVHLRADLDDRFVHVPAGPFVFGGDRLAASPGAREEKYVHDFAIARYPITCKEYLRFLTSLPLDVAVRHAPRTAALYGGKIWWTIENGQISIPRVDEAGGRWDSRYPIRSISRRDAEAYIAWRSKEENLPLRLPTEVEWEKAARGTDGRYFPWGDHFDAAFCKMRDSRPGRPEPEPVGAFAHDRSPYGIHDMAGNCSEWVADAYDKYHLLGNLKGGYWRGGETACRVAGRFASDPEEPAPFAGFRLALELGKYGGSSV